jgi:hypothetical protein
MAKTHIPNPAYSKRLIALFWRAFTFLIATVVLGVASLATFEIGTTGHGGGGDFDIIRASDGAVAFADYIFPIQPGHIGKLSFREKITIEGGPPLFRNLFRKQQIDFQYSPDDAHGHITQAEALTLESLARARLIQDEIRYHTFGEDMLQLLKSDEYTQRQLRPERIPAAIARVAFALCVLGFIITLYRIRICATQARRDDRGECTHCGYDLDGVTGNSCPECGRTH